MSLVALAVRTCLWRALRGMTYAGLHVYDSSIQPVDDMVIATPAPFITVSTDDQSATYSAHANTIAARELDVVIEMALATALDADGIEVPHTDSGLEYSLNLMGRQVERVLLTDCGIWSDMFRTFSNQPVKSIARRGAEIRGGAMFTARQWAITYATMPEPPFGKPAAGVWADLVAAMKADPDLADRGTVLEAAILGTEIPDWGQVQAMTGFRRGALAAVGLGPYVAGEAPPPFMEPESTGDHVEFEIVVVEGRGSSVAIGTASGASA